MTNTVTSPAETTLEESRRGKRAGSKASGAKITHAEAVRSVIEREIFTGQMAPGSAIDEEALAERFAVSRTPVREAIMQLIEAGLIEKISRQRAMVARLDVHRLLQTFESLAELEGTCARIAARRMTPGEKNALEENHHAAAAALASGDDDQYFHLGRRFHALIIRGTHNNVLIDLTHRLVVPLVPYRRFQLSRNGRKTANHTDHEAILKTVLEGNSEAAYDLLRRHNTIQGDTLAEYISMYAMDQVEP
jgi:DNA-binding GntR family transcriptional regulator